MAATTTDRRKPSAFGLLAGSLAAFFALFAFLAVQVRAGRDPALGPPEPAATAEPRRVIVHRVIVRRIVVTDRAPAQRSSSEGAASGGGTAVAGGSNGGAAAAGATSSAPAPAPSAPAASAAPVTTGSSCTS
jgi:hypothetical protein